MIIENNNALFVIHILTMYVLVLTYVKRRAFLKMYARN